MKGVYFGEWKIVNSKFVPSGRGALDCEDKWIFGYIENGEWALLSRRVVIDMSQEVFRVHSVETSRPGGSLLELGSIFGRKGLIASGLFNDGKLLHAFLVENEARDFMALSGKYKIDYRCNINIGEHNNNKKLDGVGLRIFPNGTVWI